MRTACLIFLPCFIFLVSSNKYSEQLNTIDACDYFPSPCELIDVDDIVDISEAEPFPNNNVNSETLTNTAELKECAVGFETNQGENFILNSYLKCIPDIENTNWTDLKSIAALTTDLEPQIESVFPKAIVYTVSMTYFIYVIQKNNYILELHFTGFTQEQELEIATIMYNNLPQ